MGIGTIDIAGLEGGTVTLSAEQLGALEAEVEGSLLRAGDEGWNDAVLIWNGMVAKAPALVLQPTSAADVAVAVRFATDTGYCSPSKAEATTSPARRWRPTA